MRLSIGGQENTNLNNNPQRQRLGNRNSVELDRIRKSKQEFRKIIQLSPSPDIKQEKAESPPEPVVKKEVAQVAQKLFQQQPPSYARRQSISPVTQLNKEPFRPSLAPLKPQKPLTSFPIPPSSASTSISNFQG
jgi:hypothetical protein